MAIPQAIRDFMRRNGAKGRKTQMKDEYKDMRKERARKMNEAKKKKAIEKAWAINNIQSK